MKQKASNGGAANHRAVKQKRGAARGKAHLVQKLGWRLWLAWRYLEILGC